MDDFCGACGAPTVFDGKSLKCSGCGIALGGIVDMPSLRAIVQSETEGYPIPRKVAECLGVTTETGRRDEDVLQPSSIDGLQRYASIETGFHFEIDKQILDEQIKAAEQAFQSAIRRQFGLKTDDSE